MLSWGLVFIDEAIPFVVILENAISIDLQLLSQNQVEDFLHLIGITQVSFVLYSGKLSLDRDNDFRSRPTKTTTTTKTTPATSTDIDNTQLSDISTQSKTIPLMTIP
jgi:hypothetical protein